MGDPPCADFRYYLDVKAAAVPVSGGESAQELARRYARHRMSDMLGEWQEYAQYDQYIPAPSPDATAAPPAGSGP